MIEKVIYYGTKYITIHAWSDGLRGGMKKTKCGMGDFFYCLSPLPEIAKQEMQNLHFCKRCFKEQTNDQT